MDVKKIREAMHAAPFQSFTIHTADGRSIHVPHPDFIAIMGTGRTVFVTSSVETTPSFHMIDVPLITQLEIHGGIASGA
jgi:hypothetical protein